MLKSFVKTRLRKQVLFSANHQCIQCDPSFWQSSIQPNIISMSNKSDLILFRITQCSLCDVSDDAENAFAFRHLFSSLDSFETVCRASRSVNWNACSNKPTCTRRRSWDEGSTWRKRLRPSPNEIPRLNNAPKPSRSFFLSILQIKQSLIYKKISKTWVKIINSVKWAKNS